jgi:hypothetical protein
MPFFEEICPWKNIGHKTPIFRENSPSKMRLYNLQFDTSKADLIEVSKIFLYWSNFPMVFPDRPGHDPLSKTKSIVPHIWQPLK